MTPPVAPLVAATVLGLPDGRDLAFAEYGDPDGYPVIGFHGTPGSRLQLGAVDDDARAAGVRLVALDRPGYGHSTLVPARRLEDWPRDVLAVADHLGLERFAVLGVSGGGPHALACAAALPGRLTAVAAVSSPCPPDLAPASQRRRVRWIGRLFRLPVLLAAIMATVVALMRRFPSAALRVARRWMPAADRRVVDDPRFRTYFVATSGRVSPTTARAAAQDLRLFFGRSQLAVERVTVPVAIWHGTDDRLVEPWSAGALAAWIPGAAVHLVDGEGHLLFAERAEPILRALVELAAESTRPVAEAPASLG